jgi:hypothetical protein
MDTTTGEEGREEADGGEEGGTEGRLVGVEGCELARVRGGDDAWVAPAPAPAERAGVVCV